MNRRFDKLGRIVIPKEMRDQLGFKEGDYATITLEDDKIVIRNANKGNDLVEYLESMLDGTVEDKYVITGVVDLLEKIKSNKYE